MIYFKSAFFVKRVSTLARESLKRSNKYFFGGQTMKNQLSWMAFLCLALIVTPYFVFASPSVPKVFIPENMFLFEKVVEGTKVTHNFKIHNQGTADLHIQSVKTSCGCATVNYTRTIPPAGQGSITLQLNTEGYGGKTMHKRAEITTNDPERSTISLTMEGQVGKFATISPRWVKLYGQAGETIEQTVTIVPEGPQPFQIKQVRAQKGDNIRCRLSTKKNQNQPVYVVTVENTKKEKGRYHDTVFLDTTSRLTPMIKISVLGAIQ